MGMIKTVKLPRKLKVGFSNSPANVTHATFRDLGFMAKKMGCLMCTVPADLEIITRWV